MYEYIHERAEEKVPAGARVPAALVPAAARAKGRGSGALRRDQAAPAGSLSLRLSLSFPRHLALLNTHKTHTNPTNSQFS